MARPTTIAFLELTPGRYRGNQARHSLPESELSSRHELCIGFEDDRKMRKRYFDDLKDGEQLHCQPVVMTRESIIDFGKKFDPQLFHIDEDAAND